MIATLPLLFALTVLGSPASAQDHADFAAANEKSLAGDTAGAIALYEDLLARGVLSEDVLFNLGNSYAQAGRLVDAAVAYERALRLVPFDGAVAENLGRVRARLHPNEAITRIEQPVEAVEAIVLRVPSSWARLAFASGMSAFFLGWFAARRTSRRWLRRSLGALMSLGLVAGILLGLVVGGQEWVRLDRRAVVLTDRTLEEGPDARFPDAGRARAGSRARVLDEDGAWTRIQTDEGLSGWVESAQIVVLDR